MGIFVIWAGCMGQPERDQLAGLVRLEVMREGDGDVLFTIRNPQPHSQTGTSANSPGVCPLQREPRGCCCDAARS